MSFCFSGGHWQFYNVHAQERDFSMYFTVRNEVSTTTTITSGAQ